MRLKEIVATLQLKASNYDDPDLVFIAQELERNALLAPIERTNHLPGLVSVNGAAKVLSLSADYVWKLVYAGELPSLKVGKRRLIRRSDISAFIDRKAQAEGIA